MISLQKISKFVLFQIVYKYSNDKFKENYNLYENFFVIIMLWYIEIYWDGCDGYVV